jgi:pyridoxal phosphate enzyme (YggS family)
MSFEALPGNLARVREEIAQVQAREGVSGEVTLVAVTKGHGAAAARAAAGAGLADLGENRIREALGKLDELTELRVRWHLIGHLQTNKAKFVPGRFAMVHSVDSVRVADALARSMERHDPAARLDVLLQVNVAGEEQKSGCPPEETAGLIQHVAGLPALELRGLMTMAPFTDDEGVQRQVFARLRLLRDELETDGPALPELSMGMSADYRSAVAEGATMLRLGTTLFGERPT